MSDDIEWSGEHYARGALFYGPPRSWQGRLLNWIRRRLGRDEQDEVYGYLEGADFDADTIKVTFTADGSFTLE
jgi:hypothetical protein